MNNKNERGIVAGFLAHSVVASLMHRHHQPFIYLSGYSQLHESYEHYVSLLCLLAWLIKSVRLR